MEWVIGFIVLIWLAGLVTGSGSSSPTSANKKSKKERSQNTSAALKGMQTSTKLSDSLEKNSSNIEKKQRELAEDKAVLWLTQQRKLIDDALDTPEKRKQFYDLKAKYFPDSPNSHEEVIKSTNAPSASPLNFRDESPKHMLSPTLNLERNIEYFVKSVGVKKLYHFTRVSNLRSIAARGLLPVIELEKENINYAKNDAYRYDKRLHAISISISFPNSRMFYRYRMQDPSERWAILEISPSALYELDCLFCQYNAADKKIANCADNELKGVQALKSMFEKQEGFDRQLYLNTFDPTNEQAEVLVLQKIDLKYITGVILEDQESYEQQKAALGASLPLRFSTADAIFFNTRQYARRGYHKNIEQAEYKHASRLDIGKYDDEIPF